MFLVLLLSPLAVAQDAPAPNTVRPLPGSLDSVPMFNSNSPEVIQEPGVLLSTMPPAGRANPSIHLNYPLSGDFNVFLHHIAKAKTPEDLRTLYVAVLLYNNGAKPATVNIKEASSYLSQPDAPFIPMEGICESTDKNVYAGPGDRVMTEILKGVKQPGWPETINVPAGGYAVLLNLPIPVTGLTPPLNGRSALLKLHSDEPVYLASLANFAPQAIEAGRTPALPGLLDWTALLDSGVQAGPREKPATEGKPGTPMIYGRVSGIQIGSTWSGELEIPSQGSSLCYPISTVVGGTFGTGQIQSAPLAVRTPNTAFAAHGNYGVHYDIKIPLKNNTNQPQSIAIVLGSPLKTNDSGALKFLTPPAPQVFFRGTVKVTDRDAKGKETIKYMHVVLTRGDQGQPLLSLPMKAREHRDIRVEFYYPPDATPPQTLTIMNLAPV
jgi:hypothetical protein